jgi:2C-methyl-D-erythritol 2,4-cyclodiphosphate synthase
VDKEKYIWKERNEILHKKVNRQMAEIKDLNKKSETIFDLARRFPNKTYRELESYKDADRLEEAQQIPLSESQQSQAELEPIEKGVCVVGEARKDREEMNPKIQALEEALANALAVNESHQKLNGTLQERLTEVEEDNKKLAHEIEDRVHKMRKSGL